MKTMKDLKIEEESLRNQISALTIEQRREIYAYLEDNIKDPDTYATLNYFFICGLHHFYLKKWLRGAINLSAMLIGVILLFFIPTLGIGIILVIFILELSQLFFSQRIVYTYNNECMKKALQIVLTQDN